MYIIEFTLCILILTGLFPLCRFYPLHFKIYKQFNKIKIIKLIKNECKHFKIHYLGCSKYNSFFHIVFLKLS